MARRTLNHKALRADFEAAERRKKEALGETEGQAEELEEEDHGEVEAVGGEADVVAPPKKSRKAGCPQGAAAEAASARPRWCACSVIWAVFDNSNRRVRDFPYPQTQEAEEHAKKMMAEKGSTHFVQPVKEQIEENKE